jgi:hypothetical protein
VCDSPEDVALRDDAKASATVSTVGFAVGVVGIGAAAYLLLTNGASTQGHATKAAAHAARPELVPRPLLGPNVGGIGLSGRW